VHQYAKKERYEIHPGKSACVTYGTSNPSRLLLGECEIPVVDCITYIGIVRYSNAPCSDSLCEDRVSLARRTAYSLMGARLHGMNGISPIISIHIYRIYVIPRLLFGLEAIILKDKHVASLEKYHRKTIFGSYRACQPGRLPQQYTSLVDNYQLRLTLIQARIATLLISLSNSRGHILRSIGLHQLSARDISSNS
jgi:hypothetical protein